MSIAPWPHNCYSLPRVAMLFSATLLPVLFLFSTTTLALGVANLDATSNINRKSIVTRYNPVRTASSQTTPLQVGNGHLAFGTDVTGLQTFQPFAIMSDWGWKNDSLPPGKTWVDVENYRGVSWLNHGRLVQYDFGSQDPQLEQWMISNPNRVNLGRVGLAFFGARGANGHIEAEEVAEEDLIGTKQELDLWTGVITSRFSFGGQLVQVKVASDLDTDTIGIEIVSPLIAQGRLGLSLDFPWNDGSAKFRAPFVGNWTATELHSTDLRMSPTGDGSSVRPGVVRAEVAHRLGEATFYTSLSGDPFNIKRNSSTHRYTVTPSHTAPNGVFEISIGFNPQQRIPKVLKPPRDVFRASKAGWEAFWMKSGFVDLVTGSTDERANELQRRIILSRYLMRVNEAGDTPPQEVCHTFQEVIVILR